MVTVRAPAAIDVLLPVFNAESTVESAIASICQQDFRDFRIIVIDDGSVDGSPAILRRMAAEDARIQIITTANRGIVDALNTALAASDAEFVARFDADDLAFVGRLRLQMDYLAAHPACAAVGCNAYIIDRDGKRTGDVTEFREDVIGDPYHVPAIEPYLLHPFLLARRRALVEMGGYRYVFHSEDADLYWRLFGSGNLANLVEILGEYRVHAGSVSARSVVNGRISAINSQLAAVSAQRRRKGMADIEFPRDALQAYHAAESLRAMLDLASKGLSPEETAYFEIATIAKLLELTSYRPYRLVPQDLQTIRKVFEAHYGLLPRVRRRWLVFRQLIRPAGLRPMAELKHIVPWKIMPIALWELGGHLVRRHLLRQREVV